MDMGEAGAARGRGGQNDDDVEVRAGPLEEGTFQRLSVGKEAASARGRMGEVPQKRGALPIGGEEC